jgi:DNA topoisomerase-2
MADARKTWLQKYNPDQCIDHSKKTMGFKEFIDLELIHFSVADNIRSIPNVVDGLKPGQRKILFSLFKRLPSG